MKRSITGLVVMVALLSSTSMASAQMGKSEKGGAGMMGAGMMGDGMMGGEHDGGMGMHGPGMELGGMGEMKKMMRAMPRLNLTPDQKKKVQLSTLQHQKEAIPLLGQIRTAGVEIQELLLADSVNLDKVKSKVKEKYDAGAKLEMSHLALAQEIKKMLTPEQRRQMESMMMPMGPMMESMPMMGGMMDAPAGSAKPEPSPAPSETPGGSSEGATDSKDPHHP